MDEMTTIRFDLTAPTEDQLRNLEADLSDEERNVLLEHGTEARVRARCSRSIAKASSPAPGAIWSYSPRQPNSRAAPAGRASPSPSPKII